jgi:hypothetical protein
VKVRIRKVKAMGHVLKANRVRLKEPLRLSIDSTGHAGRAVSHQPGTPSRVRIAQSNTEFAVLEVTCACGMVIHVRCDYAAAPQESARP